MLKRFTSYSFATLLTIILLQAYSCKEEIVPKAFHPRSDHEAYLHSLEEASLLEAALGRDWQQMAEQCLEHPVQINTPHQESFYFQETEAEANAYRFDARRGQKIQVNVDRENAGTMRLFIDLFRISTDDHTHVLTHIASSDQMKHRLAFEPRYDAMYILRIQPELLRGGRLHLSIVNVPSLEFPVENGDNQDIGSFFGDPRDGGRRKHHGIDIFAKRHTPILAPTDGYIRFAGERGLGGQVVWMRDRKRDMTLYFAHLQTIIVEDDTYVKMG
ncbi:MAG: M23 family metallopeptidase, partial [Saprospiraceae bacterium]|nr:M23 family metallopeptidase [Saprospiraceae bacterium]